jgi:endonuclease G, mitochondrial
VDYERYPFFVDDTRLKPENRIGTETFGNGYDLGHLAPNAAINTQYGKLAQMETFFMSNITPQKANLNRGVWNKLESQIQKIYPYANEDNNEKYHVWVIVGPVFRSESQYLTRDNDVKIAIPDAFYCILVRPFRYAHDAPTNSDYKAFLFPQDVVRNQPLDISFLKSIDAIEAATGLNFFPNFSTRQQNRLESEPASALW